eukprot:scaffold2761_cov264-Chaetoceros_neogracile.AAC.5
MIATSIHLDPRHRVFEYCLVKVSHLSDLSEMKAFANRAMGETGFLKFWPGQCSESEPAV